MNLSCTPCVFSFQNLGFGGVFQSRFLLKKKTLVNVKRGTQLKFVFNLDVFCTTLVADKDTFVALMVLPTLTK